MHSVTRAIELLELVASGSKDGRSLTELAHALGTSKSSTLATIRTLCASGLLRACEPGPRYVLGAALIRLGALASAQSPLGDTALPILDALAKTTSLTARLFINEEGHALAIARVEVPAPIQPHVQVGGRESPHASAAGKAILSTLEESQIRAICRGRLERLTSSSTTSIERLLVELELVRKRGFATDIGESIEGVTCVGAPFFAHDHACAGAFSVTGVALRLDREAAVAIGAQVQHAAARVTALLGG